MEQVMKERLETALKKNHPSWAYSAEIVVGTVLAGTAIADELFNLQGILKEVYNSAAALGGGLLVGDGLGRINNISRYYRRVLMDYLPKKSKE